MPRIHGHGGSVERATREGEGAHLDLIYGEASGSKGWGPLSRFGRPEDLRAAVAAMDYRCSSPALKGTYPHLCHENRGLETKVPSVTRNSPSNSSRTRRRVAC